MVAIIMSSCGMQTEDSEVADMRLIEAQVLATEDAYVTAEVSRDEKALNLLVDEDFVYNSGDGTTTGKQELISAILDMNMVDQTISERSVIVEGDKSIIFGTAELKVQDPGKEPNFSKLRYTSVYVKSEAQWRMLAL